MKIIKFTAENVKKLRVVEITPKGELIQVTGKNGQGKSSVLDSIWWALAGKGAIQKEPVRRGSEKGRIELDLGEYIVERRFSKSGASTIEVKSRDGASYGSPQAMLDALIGDLSFDPLAFSRMDSRQQFNELRRIAKLDIDIEAMDRLNRADYSARTEVNRQEKAMRARIAGIVVPDLKLERVDESELVSKLEDAGKHNAWVENRKAALETLKRDAREHRQRAADAESRAAKLHEEARALEELVASSSEAARRCDSEVETFVPLALIDAAPIKEALATARGNNSLLNQADRRREELISLASEADTLAARSKALTEAMESREKAKVEAISAANIPVEGLGFGDGEVTYLGIPFEQASDAERLRISVSIAMAGNPKLRVIRVRDGSLLDEDSLKALAQIAKDEDYQVWIERVDGSGKVGVVMEDGAVIADHQESLL